MDRTQFTFYDSFYHGIRGLRTRGEQAAALFAICEYALYGTEPGTLPGSAGAVYVMAKPVLDAARRKAEAGKSGGSKSKANGKQGEAKPKQEQGESQKPPKQEKEQDKEQDKEKEQMLYTPPPDGVGVYTQPPPEARTGAADAYMRRISPTPSTTSMRELAEFERIMGTEVCVRAMDAALDAGVRSWSYVRAILQRKKEAGVRSVEDWDRLEADRLRARDRKLAAQTAEETGEGISGPSDPGDNEALFRELGL